MWLDARVVAQANEARDSSIISKMDGVEGLLEPYEHILKRKGDPCSPGDDLEDDLYNHELGKMGPLHARRRSAGRVLPPWRYSMTLPIMEVQGTALCRTYKNAACLHPRARTRPKMNPGLQVATPETRSLDTPDLHGKTTEPRHW